MAEGDVLKKLAAPAYFVAALLVALPALDFLTNVWPLQPGQAVWRYGSAGLLSGFVLTPLLGVLVALAVAAACEHGRALSVLGIVSVVVAVLFVLLTGLFVLDGLQVRASVPPQRQTQFDVGIWRAVVKYLVVSGALVWLGVAARRAGRHARHTRRGARRDAPPSVLS